MQEYVYNLLGPKQIQTKQQQQPYLSAAHTEKIQGNYNVVGSSKQAEKEKRSLHIPRDYANITEKPQLSSDR